MCLLVWFLFVLVFVRVFQSVLAGVTIEEFHVAEELAIWRVRLTRLQDNHKFWIPYHRISLVWAFFLLHLQGIDVDVNVPQTMRCVLCHPTSSTPTVFEGQTSTVSQLTTRSRHGMFNYNLTHGSTSMMKHVMNDHTADMDICKEVVAATDVEEKKTKKKP